MNNSEIELELLQKFGLEKTISFCEMAAVMYDMMHKDMMKRHIKDDVCDYSYDRDWWLNKFVELSQRTTIRPI